MTKRRYTSSSRNSVRNVTRKVVLAMGGVALLVPSYLLMAALLTPEEAVASAGSTTQGGIAPGTQILHVTNLDDDGPGSLRQAISTNGPRVIVFDVAGVIRLAKDLKISGPNITIAGQTAPDPGIILTGGALRVRARDVIIQHISVRPGPGASAKDNDNRDAISIDGSSENEKHQSTNIRLENVSAGWSVDEALSLWFPMTASVTITNSIVGEALRNAGHPKGSHSMGLLVGYGVTGVQITGNLLVSNDFRNPVVVQGAQAYIANNLIFNPGQNAFHFYPRDKQGPTKVSFVRNVIKSGMDSKKHLVGILLPNKFVVRPADKIFIEGNVIDIGPDGRPMSFPDKFELAVEPPIAASNWALAPSSDVPKTVLRYAGSRPARRNPIDLRLIEGVRKGTARVIDTPPSLDEIKPVTKKVVLPEDPFGLTSNGETKLARWLCKQHLAVGGMPSASCQ